MPEPDFLFEYEGRVAFGHPAVPAVVLWDEPGPLALEDEVERIAGDPAGRVRITVERLPD